MDTPKLPMANSCPCKPLQFLPDLTGPERDPWGSQDGPHTGREQQRRRHRQQWPRDRRKALTKFDLIAGMPPGKIDKNGISGPPLI